MKRGNEMRNMKVLKKLQLNMGEQYWKENDDVIPERNGLLKFLLKYEFAYYGSELMGKEYYHFILTHNLTSYDGVKKQKESSMSRKELVDTLWSSFERQELERKYLT